MTIGNLIHPYNNNVPIFTLYFLHNSINCIFIRHFSKVNVQLPGTFGLQKKKKFQSISQWIPNVKDERTGGKRIEHLLICDTLHLSKVTEEEYNSVHHDSFSLTLSYLWQIVKAKNKWRVPRHGMVLTPLFFS